MKCRRNRFHIHRLNWMSVIINSYAVWLFLSLSLRVISYGQALPVRPTDTLKPGYRATGAWIVSTFVRFGPAWAISGNTFLQFPYIGVISVRRLRQENFYLVRALDHFNHYYSDHPFESLWVVKTRQLLQLLLLGLFPLAPEEQVEAIGSELYITRADDLIR